MIGTLHWHKGPAQEDGAGTAGKDAETGAPLFYDGERLMIIVINDLLCVRNATGVSAAEVAAVVRPFVSAKTRRQLSEKPRDVWKRRKIQLKQLAFVGCPRCGGRGFISVGAGIRGVECACTKGK